MSLLSSEHQQNVAQRRTIMSDALNRALESFCLYKEETFDAVMTQALRPIAEAMAVDRIVIDRYVKTDDDYSMKHIYRWNFATGGLAVKDSVLLSDDTGISAWLDALLNGRSLSKRISETSDDEEAIMSANGVKSFFVAPIFTRGEFWGCVAFIDIANEQLFEEELLDSMHSFARLCAYAIMSDETRQQLSEAEERTKAMLGTTPLYSHYMRQIRKMEKNILRLESESVKIYYDPLTGIFNRRFFDENLNRVIKSLSRSGGELSLLMIDIDFFMKYNDTYGHSAGDECLKIIAESLAKGVTRADDFVVRYGGEEFAAVLPNTDEEGACLLADKMLEGIRACGIPHEKSGVSDIVTASIGITTGNVSTRSRADDFIIRADELLYKSKQSGRNRSTFGRL